MRLTIYKLYVNWGIEKHIPLKILSCVGCPQDG
jgi:hypothetical protein